MQWWFFIPAASWGLFAFLLGLAIGSFLNVLIARLPLEKSILWPSSRCFACFQPIRTLDNLPIIGYLRLRGRCRHCGATFSSRYLWVELGTGLGFLALFVMDVLLNWQNIPAPVMNVNLQAGATALPPWPCIWMFLYHAFLLSCLIAAAAIDAEHRIIPPMIPYVGVAVGVLGGTLMPWPWPNLPAAGVLQAPPPLPPDAPWSLPELWGKVPAGVQLWPFYGPTFSFAPPGSWQLGLLNSVIGALAGSLAVRLIKVLFETGFGRDAMGLGDADLLMMTGAFLGWQIAVLSLFVGALTALLMKVAAVLLLDEGPPPDPNAPPVGGIPQDSRELPFGPGLAVGVVVTWFAWPWLGPAVQYVFFDWIAFGLALFVMCVGVLAAGLLLRRPEETPVSPATP